MSKAAFITLLNREDSALSPHFGKGKWVLIRDESGRSIFEQNTVLNGRAVVDIMRKHGCTDAVFTEIGPGAFMHLEQAGIRGWIGPARTPVPQLAALLDRGELIRARAPEPGSMSSHCATEKQHSGPAAHQGRAEGCQCRRVPETRNE